MISSYLVRFSSTEMGLLKRFMRSSHNMDIMALLGQSIGVLESQIQHEVHFQKLYFRNNLSLIDTPRIQISINFKDMMFIPLKEKFVHHLMIIDLSRSQNRIVVKRLVDGIRKSLSFQTKTAMFAIKTPIFAFQTVISRNEITQKHEQQKLLP